ncbi:electron transport complex, RnfABCDGE type, D subunit [Clostridiales bacterium KA00134]|nr:electron transport complex, RnfABCDGE type, D subunit [Clostridiales bacterium KA00134]
MEKNITSQEGRKLFVALAPHLRSKDTVQRIMLDVIIALLPALIGSVYFFGIKALILNITCVVSCLVSEFIYQKLAKKELQIKDLTAVVTGLLIAFNLPATAPIWMGIFGSAFAIIVVKECFGGVGNNFMNPAIAARIVLMASWAGKMTSYPAALDGVSGPTPLQLIKVGAFDKLPPLKDMIIGNIGGVLGETSAILLIIGAIYLLVRGVISWRIPVFYIASTAVFLFLLGVPSHILPYEIFGGGLILGAFFMATDYSSSPANNRGKIIFSLLCGLITAVIRVKASLPEGVSYSIALMNAATPLINKLTATSAYGEAKVTK